MKTFKFFNSNNFVYIFQYEIDELYRHFHFDSYEITQGISLNETIHNKICLERQFEKERLDSFISNVKNKKINCNIYLLENDDITHVTSFAGTLCSYEWSLTTSNIKLEFLF
jgi:hypothetical protein